VLASVSFRSNFLSLGFPRRVIPAARRPYWSGVRHLIANFAILRRLAQLSPRQHSLRKPRREKMAKSQKKTNREARKPKAEKPKKQNASNPSTKGSVAGLMASKS
jgi:hypothetical protein